MKESVKIVLGIVGGILVLGTVLFMVIFTVLNNIKNADHYNLGTDQIATVKSVIGVRKMISIKTTTQNGVSTKIYQYQSETSTNDIDQYITYLIEEEAFIPTTSDQQYNRQQYTKNSTEEGKILILTIEDTGFGYTLTIQKGKASL